MTRVRICLSMPSFREEEYNENIFHEPHVIVFNKYLVSISAVTSVRFHVCENCDKNYLLTKRERSIISGVYYRTFYNLLLIICKFNTTISFPHHPIMAAVRCYIHRIIHFTALYCLFETMNCLLLQHSSHIVYSNVAKFQTSALVDCDN